MARPDQERRGTLRYASCARLMEGPEMKIAVTGGAGFIASQIADAYVAAGHAPT